MKLITTNVALIAVLRCSYWVTHEGLQQIIECMIIPEWWEGLCLEWVDGLEAIGWVVGCRYSPVNGAAGPLIRRPGAPRLQIATHAHICKEEQTDHLQENFELCILHRASCITHIFLAELHVAGRRPLLRSHEELVSRDASMMKTPVGATQAQRESERSQVWKLHAAFQQTQ